MSNPEGKALMFYLQAYGRFRLDFDLPVANSRFHRANRLSG
jgi:hypothetical protein